MNVSPNIHAILALQQDPDPFQLVQDVLQSPLLDAALLACLGLVVCLWLALVARAYTDATRRDTTPTFWALLCFVLPFLGYLIYAVVRPLEYADERKERELRLAALRREARGEDRPAGPQEEAAEEDCYPCPSCGGAVAEDFLACPSCGEHLKDACAACSRPLEPEWILCPYCPDDHLPRRAAQPHRQEVVP
nr:PLD nuclease N-terminal domain-containing protein [Actinomycetota bacterium]